MRSGRDEQARGVARRHPLGPAHAAAAALGIAFVSGLVLAPAQGRAAETTLTVSMDKARLFRLPPSTETIIVGNPVVADVTMLKSSGLVILTGRGFGETNLVLLDRAGTVLSESNVKVEPSSALVIVQRGGDRESYACQPRCEPTVSLGDASGYMGDAIKNITARNAASTGSATH